MWIILISITNFVLDSDILHKVIGPFESEDSANTYLENNKEKIEQDIKSSLDDDDEWYAQTKEVFSPWT